jgi:molybdopterin-guanine dinucleotide biosynthesis protein A
MAATSARPATARTGGLILCGGRSSRMGMDKARLRFGPVTLLDVAVRHMAEVSDEIVISLAADGDPPAVSGPLPAAPLRWVRDDAAYRGPLFGLLHGFRALAPAVELIVVMPVDMPFLDGPWLRRLLEGMTGHAACVFRWEGFTNALTAAYRADLLPRLEQLVAEGKQRPIALLEGLDAPLLEVETLWRPEDGPSPMLDTDTPEDYRRALAAAGLTGA